MLGSLSKNPQLGHIGPATRPADKVGCAIEGRSMHAEKDDQVRKLFKPA
jgi:hypothetical protein